jgi:signal recognition particle receptor subunit beta
VNDARGGRRGPALDGAALPSRDDRRRVRVSEWWLGRIRSRARPRRRYPRAVPIFDPIRRRLVTRVVYDGPAFAGKTTNVQAVCAAFPVQKRSEVYTPGALRGRTMFFDWLELDLGKVGSVPIACQVLSVPGQRARSYRRRPLVQSADALVFVADARPEALDENRRCYALMRRYLRERGSDVPLIVQANKLDAEGAMTTAELRAALRVPESSPVVGAMATKDRGVRECFNLAVKSAVRLAQLRVAEQGLRSITGTPDTADGLLDAMLTVEDHLDGEAPEEIEPTDEELGQLVSA